MPDTTTHDGLTVETYLAGKRPMREYGVAVFAGRVELAREEEFWSPGSVERALPRIIERAKARLADMQVAA